MKKLLTLAMLWAFSANGQADSAGNKTASKDTVKSKKWYDNISMRGYMQVRYNRLLETNPKLKCDQCDRSIGEGGGIFF